MQPVYLSHRAGAMRRELPNSGFGFNGFDFDFDFREKFENKGGARKRFMRPYYDPPLGAECQNLS